MESSIQLSIRRYLYEEVVEEDKRDQINEDRDLVGESIIDSLGIFLLVEFIENEFGISVEAHEVTIENFSTIGNIAGFVEAKRAATLVTKT